MHHNVKSNDGNALGIDCDSCCTLQVQMNNLFTHKCNIERIMHKTFIKLKYHLIRICHMILHDIMIKVSVIGILCQPDSKTNSSSQNIIVNITIMNKQ